MKHVSSISILSALCTSALLTGCPGGDDGTSTSGAETTSTSAGSSSGTAPVTTDATTSPGSTADSGSTTNAGSTTNVGSAGSTDSGGSSTGPVATTDAGTTAADTGTSTAGDTSTVEEDYADCANNGPMSCPMDQFCVQVFVGAACGVLGCETPMDCPSPSSGNPTVSCETLNVEPFGTVCALLCEGGETCPDGMECVNDFACLWRIPGWTCDAAFYGVDDGCDCGCGVVDPDCADATLASCEYCDDPGSCTDLPCAEAPIDPSNNAVCM